jgi:cytochrome c556
MSRLPRLRSLALLALVAGAFVGADASAKKPKPAPVEAAKPERTPAQSYRHEAFELLGHHMKAASLVAKGGVDRPGDVAMHARAMFDIAATLGELFPEGSGPEVGRTDALPAVWAQPDLFAEKVKAFQAATAELVVAAGSGDAEVVKGALGATGAACGSCHEVFRADD